MRTSAVGLSVRASGAPISAVNLRREAEGAAGALPPILVAATRVAATVYQGVHGRRRVGQGYSFWQFRRYQTGDPASLIDWRQSAKTAHAYVRENEWDAAQSVYLWCDRSASMAYRSRADLPLKGERVAVLTLALASLLVRGGEQVTLIGLGHPPSSGRAVLNRIGLALVAPNPNVASLPMVEPLPRHARLVLVGDFLSPVPEIERIIRSYAARGVRGHLVQVLDPAEEALPFAGRVRFRGFEGEGDALVGRVETVRADYAGLIRAHRAALGDLARALGWTFAHHSTDRPPQAALLALHAVLSQNPES